MVAQFSAIGTTALRSIQLKSKRISGFPAGWKTGDSFIGSQLVDAGMINFRLSKV
jgi:hypothetical protein